MTLPQRIVPPRPSRQSNHANLARAIPPSEPLEVIHRATVTIAQHMTGEEELKLDAADLFQFELTPGQQLKRSSRKFFRSRDVSDVRVALTPDSSPQVWITEITFARDIVFRGFARRVHIDAELRPDEQISVVVSHSEVLP
jgi:hypothetical protein